MKVKGTYSINYDTYYVVVEYEYYWKDKSYDSDFEDELTIKSITLDNNDITDFCYEYIKEEDLIQDVKEYAIENKYENLN